MKIILFENRFQSGAFLKCCVLPHKRAKTLLYRHNAHYGCNCYLYFFAHVQVAHQQLLCYANSASSTRCTFAGFIIQCGLQQQSHLDASPQKGSHTSQLVNNERIIAEHVCVPTCMHVLLKKVLQKKIKTLLDSLR